MSSKVKPELSCKRIVFERKPLVADGRPALKPSSATGVRGWLFQMTTWRRKSASGAATS
jgi:hypothetical protein